MKSNFCFRIATLISCIMLMVLVGVSCGNKKKTDYIIVHEEETPAPKKPTIISTEAQTASETVDWNGKNYTFHISKSPDKDLPTVSNEEGQKFYDNKADLKVVDSEGSTLFSRTFRKSSFEQYLPASFMKNGILEGFVYDSVDNGRLQFIASVAYPETDEYVLFDIRLSKDGNITIVKDNRM